MELDVIEYVGGRPRMRTFGGRLGCLPSELRMELAHFYLEPTFEFRSGGGRHLHIIYKSGPRRSVCKVDLRHSWCDARDVGIFMEYVERGKYYTFSLHRFYLTYCPEKGFQYHNDCMREDIPLGHWHPSRIRELLYLLAIYCADYRYIGRREAQLKHSGRKVQ